MERLTGLDAAFLYLETPTHHMHVAMTMVLDPATMPGGYSFDKIKDFISKRLHLVPPFRRRLVNVPLNLHHPVWVDDPHFDLDYHIRRIGCPAPGGRRELGEMAGQIASSPLDRSRPLWELWVVEGLKQNRIGVVTKVHHAAIDGASGAELMVHLFSLEADAPDPAPAPPSEPEKIPNEFELLGYAAASKLRRYMTLPQLIGSTVSSVNRVVQGRRDPLIPVGAAPLTAPRTSWTGPLSTGRTVGFARASQPAVKELKSAYGCTVNDIVLALCTGTLRHYMIGRDELPDAPLVATCPVSVRPDGETTIGNQVSAMFTTLPTHIDDVPERVSQIQACTAGAKAEHTAGGPDMQLGAPLGRPADPDRTADVAVQLRQRSRPPPRRRAQRAVAAGGQGPPEAQQVVGRGAQRTGTGKGLHIPRRWRLVTDEPRRQPRAIVAQVLHGVIQAQRRRDTLRNQRVPGHASLQAAQIPQTRKPPAPSVF